VKPREERQKVMIRARMRAGASWNDVAILDLSTRGLGIRAADPPGRGTYVEICRGPHVIVARVMWTNGQRAGLRAQDVIWVQALINEPSNDRRAPPAASAVRPVERRTKPRTAQQRHEDSRLAGRAAEFACIALAGAAMAMAAFGMVEQALAQPLARINAAMAQD
jgi:hypothetical protein